MVFSLSGPPSPARGTLVNSMEGPETSRQARQPLNRTQKRRKRALSLARLFENLCAVPFSFQRLSQRKQTRLRQGAKLVLPIIGDPLSSVRSPYLNHVISY